MSKNESVIIFDLDGTLLDTSKGIFGSVRYAETKMGLEPVEDFLLSQFVGPPPKDMYMKVYGLSEQEALKAVGFHREYGGRYAIFEAKVYDGIPETLTELRKQRFRIAIATLKKKQIAEEILEYFGLYRFFDTIVGMNDEETLSKRDTIDIAMKNLDTAKAIMIGDSDYDYLGAVEAGVDFIGVSYGFGFTRDKMYDFEVANSPGEIIESIKTLRRHSKRGNI